MIPVDSATIYSNALEDEIFIPQSQQEELNNKGITSPSLKDFRYIISTNQYDSKFATNEYDKFVALCIRFRLDVPSVKVGDTVVVAYGRGEMGKGLAKIERVIVSESRSEFGASLTLNKRVGNTTIHNENHTRKLN